MRSGAAVLVIVLAAGVLTAADVSGDWLFEARVLNDSSYARVTLKVDGEKLSGTVNENQLEGTIRNDFLTFTVTRPNGQRFGTPWHL